MGHEQNGTWLTAAEAEGGPKPIPGGEKNQRDRLLKTLRRTAVSFSLSYFVTIKTTTTTKVTTTTTTTTTTTSTTTTTTTKAMSEETTNATAKTRQKRGRKSKLDHDEEE